MKTLILVLASMTAISASADPMMYISASKITSSGSVAPMFAHSTNCTIRDGLVTTFTSGALVKIAPLTTAVVYTNDVPNETVMGSLVLEALHGHMEYAPGLIGGSTVTYLTEQTTMKSIMGGQVNAHSTSPAALRLEKFLDTNCK